MKAIPGFEGYFITKKGKVFTNKSGELKRKSTHKGTNVLPYIYCSLRKEKGKKAKMLSIHRLVALTFISNPNNFPQVLHIDNNPLNNSYKNLKWGTHQMNMDQMINEGRDNKATKYSVEDCKKIIRLFKQGYKPKKIYELLGYPLMSVYFIINLKSRNSKIANSL